MNKLILSLVLAGCVSSAFAGETFEKIKSSNTFTIGYRDSAFPYSSLTKDGQPQGYTIDLCKQIHKDFNEKYKLDTKIEYKLVTASSRIPLTETGNVDFSCESMTITPERLKRVNIIQTDSDTVNASVLAINHKKPGLMSSIFGTSGGGKLISELTDMKEARVVVVGGSTGEEYVRNLNSKSGFGMKVIVAKSYPECFKMVEEGKADAVVTNKVLLKGEVQKMKNPAKFDVLDFKIGEVQGLGIAYMKNDMEIDNFLKEEIAKFKENGVITKTHDAWFNSKAGDTGINLGITMTPDHK
jgi:ABC-type amino acid transport substrate-binding protein